MSEKFSARPKSAPKPSKKPRLKPKNLQLKRQQIGPYTLLLNQQTTTISKKKLELNLSLLRKHLDKAKSVINISNKTTITSFDGNNFFLTSKWKKCPYKNIDTSKSQKFLITPIGTFAIFKESSAKEFKTSLGGHKERNQKIKKLNKEITNLIKEILRTKPLKSKHLTNLTILYLARLLKSEQLPRLENILMSKLPQHLKDKLTTIKSKFSKTYKEIETLETPKPYKLSLGAAHYNQKAELTYLAPNAFEITMHPQSKKLLYSYLQMENRPPRATVYKYTGSRETAIPVKFINFHRGTLKKAKTTEINLQDNSSTTYNYDLKGHLLFTRHQNGPISTATIYGEDRKPISENVNNQKTHQSIHRLFLTDGTRFYDLRSLNMQSPRKMGPATYFNTYLKAKIKTKTDFFRYEAFVHNHSLRPKQPKSLQRRILKHGLKLIKWTKRLQTLKKEYGITIRTRADIGYMEKLYFKLMDKNSDKIINHKRRLTVKEFDQILKALEKNLERYPKVLTKKISIKRIMLLANETSSTAGSNIIRRQHFTQPEEIRIYGGYNRLTKTAEVPIDSTIHHEICHSLEKSIEKVLPIEQWIKYSHKIKPTLKSVKRIYLSKKWKHLKKPPKGFISEYATKSPWEDQSEVMSFLITSQDTYKKIMKKASKDPILMRKVNMMKYALLKISDGKIDQTYWKDIERGETIDRGYWELRETQKKEDPI